MKKGADDLKQRQRLKILVPVLILAVIAGIWAIKNSRTQNEQFSQSSSAAAESENPDFALKSDTMDMTQLSAYGVPIIIDFGADWCGPCREFEPTLEAAHDKVGESALIKYVDVDASSDIAANYPVKVIPTQIFFAADGSPYVPGDTIQTTFITYADSSGKHIFTAHEGGLSADELDAILSDMGVAQ